MRFIMDPISTLSKYPRRVTLFGACLFAVSIATYWSHGTTESIFAAGFAACLTCIAAIKTGETQ